MGFDPVEAVKMVTSNPAEHYKLDVGKIMPGKAADMVLVDNLENLDVKKVFLDGNLVAENGEAHFKINPVKLPSTFKLNPLNASDFNIPADGSFANVRTIEVVEDQLITKEALVKLKIVDSNIETDQIRDVLKIAVVERYGHGRINTGFVKGFGIKDGAIASSVAHDSHNIITVGTNNEDIATAVNTILKNKGGLSIVSKGVVKNLELPIAGLMSNKPVREVAYNLRELHEKLQDMGAKIDSPFMIMSFLALLVIPNIKISDMGLFDVQKFGFVDLIENEFN